MWHQQLADWVTSGTWTNETLSAVLVNHVTNLVEHFGDRCYAWDVVNEALSDSGTGNLNDAATWRQDIWYDTIGPEFINIAFKAAQNAVKKHNLKVKLYYNDYNIESAGNKSTAAQALVKRLKVGKNSKVLGVPTDNSEPGRRNPDRWCRLTISLHRWEFSFKGGSSSEYGGIRQAERRSCHH